jgi:hypothetical protein
MARVEWNDQNRAKLLRLKDQGLDNIMLAQRFGGTASGISSQIRKMNREAKERNEVRQDGVDTGENTNSGQAKRARRT